MIALMILSWMTHHDLDHPLYRAFTDTGDEKKTGNDTGNEKKKISNTSAGPCIMYPQALLKQSVLSSFLTNSAGVHTSMHVLLIWLIQQLQENPDEIQMLNAMN